MYKILIRPFLFLFPPEVAHHITFFLAGLPGIRQLISLIYKNKKYAKPSTAFGLQFPNRVGLAAGLDKNARYLKTLEAMGFGFVEIGTVTPLPQAGNPKPRLFRIVKDQALINRMGFNNDGMETIAKRLANQKTKLIIGGNIGKNKITPNEEAVLDYEKCFRALYPYVHYFVVNVSSPNTPGLRELQEKEPLLAILTHLNSLNEQTQRAKPILLKIAPDLTDAQLDDVVEIVKQSGIQGIIATNTTISRKALTTNHEKIENIGNGGLSGQPLSARSTEVIRYIHQKSGGKIPIVGVGGIHSASDAKEKLQAGASLVQIYTGLIYEGPRLIKNILKKIQDNTFQGA